MRSLLLFTLTVSGCARSVDQAELPGRYEFRLDSLAQQVTIAGDGKYTNAFYRSGELIWSDQGDWTYEREKQGVTFAQFRFGIPGHSTQPGYWFVVPEKSLVGIKKLCFDPDLYYCFKAD
ncbi:MAG: hypothetical protein EPO27_20575 [Betaproteobacteria bacterium]|nr:MAG: hypothetical protein EPO27_20575 [Betaproteobacteria bacterium]